MHIHSNQMNPNIQLDALEAAQKAAAQQEAANTRKKLREFSAKVGAESELGEDCVVKLGKREEPESQTEREQRNPKSGKKPKNEGAAGAKDSVSEWA
ncbi:MAG: hypothetical protein ABSG16_20045 [Candidatus Acidiferrum sp.]|jgi:hypothetical protein